MKERESKGNVLEVHKENGGRGGRNFGGMDERKQCLRLADAELIVQFANRSILS
jgi:hypothetical protein